MRTGSQIERRCERSRGVRFGRPAFMNIPASIAAPTLGFAFILAEMADYLLAHKVWFGPIYLIISAFAAWFINGRYAIGLILIVFFVNCLTGSYDTYLEGDPRLIIMNISFKLLCVIAVILMLGLARKSLEREWRLARIDPLTGALNRQAFFEAINVYSSKPGPSILAFADVDGLKNLNDTRGHELGDDGLRNFAGRVRKSIRHEDIFARLGGDEFVIFMKVKDEKSAKIVSKRLSMALNQRVTGNEIILKCSLGILFLPRGSVSIDAELKLADKLMYSAKRAKAGLLMASAAQLDGQKTVLPASARALPANRKSVVRQEMAHIVITPDDPEPMLGGGTRTDALRA